MNPATFEEQSSPIQNTRNQTSTLIWRQKRESPVCAILLGADGILPRSPFPLWLVFDGSRHKHNKKRCYLPVLSISRKPPSYSNLNTSDEDFHCHDDVEAAPPATNLKARRILWLSVALCLFFMVCEVVGGFLANSLAIVTDAAHLATDFASMLISLFSLYIAARPPSRRMSFGFHRAEVLGAFFSVFLIWIVTGFLVYEAVNRIILGQHVVDSVIMAITAALGVLVNLIMGALLYSGGHTHSHSHGFGGHGHGHGGEDNHSHVHEVDDLESEGSISTESSPNINVRAAFIHVLGDLIQSIGVLIAALIIFFFPHLTIVDPVCTLMFSVIVLGTTIYILRDAMVVLLEGKPSSIDFAKVFNSLEKLEGVKKVHDLRIWALTMDKVAVSAHLEVADPAVSQSVLKTARSMLRREFRVHECTVQIETYRDSDCGRCDMPTR